MLNDLAVIYPVKVNVQMSRGWSAVTTAGGTMTGGVCLCVAGRGGGQLPRGRDGVVAAEDDADPRRLRVPGVHHSVGGNRHPGPVHLARGNKTHKQTKAAAVALP